MTTATNSPLEKWKSEGRLTVSIEEAGAAIGVGRGRAFEMAKQGQLPTIPAGDRRKLVPIAALERLLSGGKG